MAALAIEISNNRMIVGLIPHLSRDLYNYRQSYFATFPSTMNPCKKSTAAFAVSI